MSQTVEAEVSIDGTVRLLEPLHVSKPTRALVTLLDINDTSADRSGNAFRLLKFLQENRLPDTARPNADEIEPQIAEARESWD